MSCLVRTFLLLAFLPVASGCSSTALDALPTTPPPGYEFLPSAEESADIVAPKAIHRVTPALPPNVRDATATIEAIITAEGRVESVWLSSGNAELGRSLAAAVRQWRFEPATRDGVAIATRFRLTTRVK